MKVFDCEISHSRFGPKAHHFKYRNRYFLLELTKKDQSLPWWFSFNRFNAFSIYESDYLTAGNECLLTKLQNCLRDRNYPSDFSEVKLLTCPRYFGYSFNPVSFYFCYREQRKTPSLVVTEINNTFSEKHIYIQNELDSMNAPFEVAKSFHVSPFFSKDMNYDFRFSVRDLDEAFSIQISLKKQPDKLFHSSLTGRALKDLKFIKLLTRPLEPWLTMPRILWQAALLHYKKGLRVYSKPIPDSSDTIKTSPDGWLQSFCTKTLLNLFANTKRGKISFVFPDQTEKSFEGKEPGRNAKIYIHRYDFFSKSVLGSDIGFGESYTDGDWSSPDPAEVLRFLIQNEDFIFAQPYFLSKVEQVRMRFYHRWRANNRRMAKRNIEAHYDLSNEFFASFLDPAMQYSCAFFESPVTDLEDAQKAKIDRLTRPLLLNEKDHVLEIGCGWGGLAIETVKRYGCRWTGITLSQQQLEWAKTKVKEAGLEDKIEILLCDYRDIQGRFTKAISIEMLEAVGHENLGDYFKSLERVLEPEALVSLQVITMPENRYEAYRKRPDWLQKHIFPGAVCPSFQALVNAMANHSNFMVHSTQNIGSHYAQTLREWEKRFSKASNTYVQLGFDESFCRKWTYYFKYCEAAFEEGYVFDHQIVLSRPKNNNLKQL